MRYHEPNQRECHTKNPKKLSHRIGFNARPGLPKKADQLPSMGCTKNTNSNHCLGEKMYIKKSSFQSKRQHSYFSYF